MVVCYGLIQHLAAGGVDWARANFAAAPRAEGVGWRESAPVRALASFGFVLVAALAATTAASYWNVRTLAEGNKLVVHTHEVITRLRGVLSLLKHAETGQRSYLLTGRDEYLAPYREAVARVPGEVDRLAELTADNAEQQARVPALRARVGEKLGELDEAVATRRERGHDAALAVVLSDRGKRVMDDIRTAVGELEATELAAPEARAAAADARVRRTLASIVGTTLFVLGLTLARGLVRLGRRPEGAA